MQGLGWLASVPGLLLGLMLAVLASITPANEYAASLGMDALDCDGPIRVYLMAAPALALLALSAAAHANGWRQQRRLWRLIAALVAIAASIPVLASLWAAIEMDRSQQDECALAG